MMQSLRLSSIGSSLILAVAAIGITGAAVLAAGSIILPDQGPAAWQLDPAGVPGVDDLDGSQALLVVSGSEEGRYELNQLTVGDWNEEAAPNEPLKLSLTFRGDNASLVISATGVTTGAPATGDAASATLSIPGGSYFANDGQCTITLGEVDHVVLEPQPAVLDGIPRGVPIPTYAGTVECSGVTELRTDRMSDIYAVFRHRPSG